MSNPECYQALELLAPEILSQDPSSRFQMLDGFPKLYERAQHKILESEANIEPEPLIIRPSVQWYACEETDLTKEEKRRIEKSNKALKDQFGVWHVCYSMHSSKLELERALRLLAPKWVVSTTPSCRAVELQYFKKHCLSRPVPSDSPLWKLLDIEVESFTEVASVEEGGRCLPSTEELNQSVGEYKSMLLVESSKKRVLLNSSPLTSNPPVTLFGRARLGFDSRIYFYEKKTAALENNDTQQLVMREDEEQMPPSCNHELDFVNQMSSERAIHSGVLTTPAPEVNSLNVSDNKLEESCKEMQSDESVVGDLELCKAKPHCSTGLSKGYGINLRKLYWSMNVPVPEPLPSLVELGTSLRAKRIR